MPKPKILLQFDSDPHPSSFDSVVAIDAGVDQLLQYANVTPESVRELVHGAIFTRGPADLVSTAIFIGGSDVAVAQRLAEQTRACFFSSLRVSVMLDASGANTTAAAAVLAAARHLELAGANVLVLGATGPVGRRVVRLAARAGARVGVVSRRRERADQVCHEVADQVPGATLEAHASSARAGLAAAINAAQVIVAAGALGVQLLAETDRRQAKSLRVAIDLNAVPPVGIEGLQPTDRATDRDAVICYGPVGVGGTKMKIHKAAIRQLFEANDLVLDAEAIYAIGQSIESP